ncbi:MAG: PilZ domain-containing protein [Candidatus Omnitrophica bacterium]|nr:PilZ domain-containing protein [Candidatus Omnitrophota bacterium]
MRTSDFVEKRRFKRLDLTLPTELKRLSDEKKWEAQEGVTINVSYNGAYVGDISIKNMNAGDTLNISLSVPKDESRDFPFSRIAGKARVIRVAKDGIALEFDEDINRLFIAN